MEVSLHKMVVDVSCNVISPRVEQMGHTPSVQLARDATPTQGRLGVPRDIWGTVRPSVWTRTSLTIEVRPSVWPSGRTQEITKNMRSRAEPAPASSALTVTLADPNYEMKIVSN